LRATAHKITECLVLGFLAFAAPWLAACGAALSLSAGTHVLAQSPPAPGPSAPPSARDLLFRARLAMRDGRFDEAESLIQQAERAGVSNDPLMGRYEDSPEKARRTLASLRTAAGGPGAGSPPIGPNGPGGQFGPTGRPSTGQGSPTGSNAPGGPAGTAAGASRYSNPDSPSANRSAMPAGGPSSIGSTGRGSDVLFAARRALAQGDAAAAARYVASAKAGNATYDPNGDSPARVESLVESHQRFAAGPRPGADPNVFHREYAEFLMDQADALIAYNDLDSATGLAQRARSLPIAFRPFERNPDAILQNIAARRRMTPATANGPSARPGAGSPAGGDLTRLPATGAGAGQEDARRLVAQAQMELERGNLPAAQQLADRARAMDVAWEPNETQPWQVLLEVGNRMRRRPASDGVAQAGYEGAQASGTGQAEGAFPVRQGAYDPASDRTRVSAASNAQPATADPARAANSEGLRLYQDGLKALESQDPAGAIELFRKAWRFEAELDPATRQQLKDKLTLMGAANGGPREASGPIEEINARQQIAQQQLFREINNEQRAAEQQRMTDPKGALNRLQTLHARVTGADIDPAAKQQFLAFVERTIRELETFIDQNRSAIELDERNTKVRAGIESDQRELVEVQDKLADIVQQFNTLMEEKRFAEAEILAKQAKEIAPDDPVAQNLVWKSSFARSVMADLDIKEQKEHGMLAALQSVEESSTPFDDRKPIVFGDRARWDELTRSRLRMMQRENKRMSADEIEIQKALDTKVSVNLRDAPLHEALKTLCDLAGVPLFIDPHGLAVETVTTDQPVSIELPKEIPLRSALNLILQPLRLSYVIENDVLKITSEGTRDAKVFPDVYYIADLVIPIPNFMPGHTIGLPEAIREAHASLAQFSNGGMPFPLTVAADADQAALPASVLAQTNAFGKLPQSRARPIRYSNSRSGFGGVTEADFDPLIQLITSTISPDSWEDNGGNGAIEPFVANLSLVVSQTQEVHEQIRDLLDQLRRLQDLQVTIEVKFITLNDEFFERIGIDMDFNIDDNSGLSTRTPFVPDDDGPSTVIGLNPLGEPTADLDLQFNQDSFGSAVPQFGGFDAATAANFGFAILSDIEAYFLLQAAQGDRRSNVLQAPKVTMFNGQLASINDTANKPFVTQIIPVVADFAAAHMPVITVLSEGTSLSVQAVVSQDRRFVRLTLVPVFSQIGEVSTFTFTGRTTTDTGTNVLDPDGNPLDDKDNVTKTTEGATVQLPTFLSTSVSTTVNVPDGGTILLGGIKRLSEGRNERGVPMLSKIPYVNRLFKNVGIGRSTNSLMMMVTPRIIIQQEEEERAGLGVE